MNPRLLFGLGCIAVLSLLIVGLNMASRLQDDFHPVKYVCESGYSFKDAVNKPVRTNSRGTFYLKIGVCGNHEVNYNELKTIYANVVEAVHRADKEGKISSASDVESVATLFLSWYPVLEYGGKPHLLFQVGVE